MAAAFISTCSLAQAQTAAPATSQVTLYGVVDLGLRNGSGLTASNAPTAGSSHSLGSGIHTTSRWGLRGNDGGRSFAQGAGFFGRPRLDGGAHVLAADAQLVQGGAVTRGHFARFLVECGKASSMADVFKKYLARGKTGYVPPQWCTIKQAIDVIHHSGGKAVIAHPGRYDLSAKWLKRLLAHFSEQGGDAMELAQCQQAPHERTQLAAYAVQFGLLGSQGSDFHQPCPWIELGRKLWLPAGVEGIWHSWETAAE